MSNKTDLQENNVKLQTIKNNVEELPESNAWTGQTSIVPGTQAITIPAYTDEELTIQGDVNLIAENIKQGITIFGILGTASADLSSFGIDFGEITMNSTQQKRITIPHSLGVAPTKVIFTKLDYDNNNVTHTVVWNKTDNKGSFAFTNKADWIPTWSTDKAVSARVNNVVINANMNLAGTGEYPFDIGQKYLWVVVK